MGKKQREQDMQEYCHHHNLSCVRIDMSTIIIEHYSMKIFREKIHLVVRAEMHV